MAKPGGGGVSWSDRELAAKLTRIPVLVDRAIVAAMQYHATRATAWARQNARWTDRTGNARNGLSAKAETQRPKYRIVISHGVPYGVWLEVRFSGRNQIIRPTVDHEGPEVMRTVAGLFGRL